MLHSVKRKYFCYTLHGTVDCNSTSNCPSGYICGSDGTCEMQCTDGAYDDNHNGCKYNCNGQNSSWACSDCESDGLTNQDWACNSNNQCQYGVDVAGNCSVDPNVPSCGDGAYDDNQNGCRITAMGSDFLMGLR